MAIEQGSLTNTLLSSLPPEQFKRIAGAAERITLAQGARLFEPGAAITHLVFPETCLVALFAVADRDMLLEVALAGVEGVVGATVTLGSGKAALRAVVQKPGAAIRVPVDHLLRVLPKMPDLQNAILGYAGALLIHASQTAVCSRYHILEARLARILLTTRDRLGANSFHLTHEFLAQALGVRRVGVTKAATALQNLKLISYSRGDITVLDEAGLEAASCSCYAAIKSAAG